MSLKKLPLVFAVLLCAHAHAQSPFASPSAKPSATPFRGFQTETNTSGEPLRDVPLAEKKWEQLANIDVSRDGQTALAINPQKWKHAETENFILHYRRVTEAQKVAREVEYDLWFVAKTLGADKSRYQRKSHVYVFEDEKEWKKFVPQTGASSWAASFAFGDELFLNVRQDTGQFDSQTLAHETTHAVVARLYRRQRWPLWLSEGFAEYMGNASVAARKNQTVKRHERTLSNAKLSLDQLMKISEYPTDNAQVWQLYESSEKLVRFLMTELPQDRFTKFIDATLAGKSLKDALLEIYGDELKSYDDFLKKYERFSK